MRLLPLLLLLFLTQPSVFGQRRSVPSGSSVAPFVLGEKRAFRSGLLREIRELNIYLPEGYSQTDSVRYPVVYLLDGSADEDFIHIAGLYQFSAFPWVGHAPPSIVVGIANTDRKRDFTFPTSVVPDKATHTTVGGSAKFIRFLEEELQPYVEATYRTTSTKTLIGQSLGGLLAAEILLKKPQLFTHYLLVSPSLWWDGGSLLKAPLDAFKKTPDSLRIYLAVGKEGLTPGPMPRVMEVDVHLFAEQLEKAAGPKARIHLDYLPGENHATILHTAAAAGLRWLYAM